MTRETVGKVASDLMQKAPETTSPVEQMRESLTEYEQNLVECVERCKKEYLGDFYVVVLTRAERLMENVFRNQFFGRLSCPTPTWDQTLYKYKRNNDQIIFMWCIPSKDACEYLTINSHLVVKEEQQLLKYVLAYNDGSLMRLAKDLNGEKEDSPELRDFVWKG